MYVSAYGWRDEPLIKNLINANDDNTKENGVPDLCKGSRVAQRRPLPHTAAHCRTLPHYC
jgi:hypothetical protein